MNSLARLVVERPRLAWLLVLAVSAALTWLAASGMRADREDERLLHLANEAERRGIELTSQTLAGSLMGALSLLGLIEPEFKREGRDGGKAGFVPNTTRVFGGLESVARAYGVDGVFVVAGNGFVASSWDSSGKPSSGLDVRFRPYYQTAMRGKENVYAAVSIARGDRALYFAAPIYPDNRKEGTPIGVIVGRSGVARIDELLREPADIALLLSPQGVVFASSRKEWVGRLAGEATPERLRAIRELKQFGSMFERDRPGMLPVAIRDGLHVLDGRRHAVASARVDWNDPSGDWKLVLVEDLSRSIPADDRWPAVVGSALALLLCGGLLLGLLRSQYRQQLAAQQLDAYARAQEAAVARKGLQAAAALRLQQARNPQALAQAFLREAHGVLGALQGVVYVADADGTLARAASYACVDEAGLPDRLAPGEGLLGQCAADRRLQVLAPSPAGFATIRSGLGEARPAALVIAPVQLKEALLGVVELAVLTAPDAIVLEQCEELLRLLAMNLEIVAGESPAAAGVVEADL